MGALCSQPTPGQAIRLAWERRRRWACGWVRGARCTRTVWCGRAVRREQVADAQPAGCAHRLRLRRGHHQDERRPALGHPLAHGGAHRAAAALQPAPRAPGTRDACTSGTAAHPHPQRRPGALKSVTWQQVRQSCRLAASVARRACEAARTRSLRLATHPHVCHPLLPGLDLAAVETRQALVCTASYPWRRAHTACPASVSWSSATRVRLLCCACTSHTLTRLLVRVREEHAVCAASQQRRRRGAGGAAEDARC